LERWHLTVMPAAAKDGAASRSCSDRTLGEAQEVSGERSSNNRVASRTTGTAGGGDRERLSDVEELGQIIVTHKNTLNSSLAGRIEEAGRREREVVGKRGDILRGGRRLRKVRAVPRVGVAQERVGRAPRNRANRSEWIRFPREVGTGQRGRRRGWRDRLGVWAGSGGGLSRSGRRL